MDEWQSPLHSAAEARAAFGHLPATRQMMAAMGFRVASYLAGAEPVSFGLLRAVLSVNTMIEQAAVFADLQQCIAVTSTFYDNEQSTIRQQGKQYSALLHQAGMRAGLTKSYDPNEQSYLTAFVKLIDELAPEEMARMGNAQSAQHQDQSANGNLEESIEVFKRFKSWWDTCDKSRAWVFPFWYVLTHVGAVANPAVDNGKPMCQLAFVRKVDVSGRPFSGAGQTFERAMFEDVFTMSDVFVLVVHDVPLDWSEGADAQIYSPLRGLQAVAFLQQ